MYLSKQRLDQFVGLHKDDEEMLGERLLHELAWRQKMQFSVGSANNHLCVTGRKSEGGAANSFPNRKFRD